jgi:acetyl-CoA carboxylase carboxyl transferase subunit alpha
MEQPVADELPNNETVVVDEQTPEEAPVLDAWQRVKLARHAERPHTLTYIDELFRDFVELHGDRTFGDDHAMVGGLATFRGRNVLVLGHQKGTNTRENIDRNFGMPRPEGYRKARRLMQHAEKFALPIITFIDTPAADPGIGSEERGQGTAIAEALLVMVGLKVPIVTAIIGEGGSGGALAISLGDRLLMLENAVYAVASPEACATILWRDAAKAAEAAVTMRVSAADLARFGIVDELIPEPRPANEAPRETIATVGNAIARQLDELMTDFDPDDEAGVERLLRARYDKYRRIGAWQEG